MSLMKHFFPSNETFSYEALRAAGYANASGADLGEVIYICSKIRPGNEDQWLKEWSRAAEASEEKAGISLKAGNPVSAYEGYLRASNYFRTAEFFRREDPDNDTIAEHFYDKSVSCFEQAMKLNPYHYSRIEIPYQDQHLPGFFLSPDNTGVARPTIILNGGYDSTKEETWFAFSEAALKRGYNVLAFDGPGQGECIRKMKLYFRPDWEVVIKATVDYALTRKEIDQSKIILFGWSMGGYLAARAASVDHRLAALILNDGVYDFGLAFRKKSSSGVDWLINNKYDSITTFLVNLVLKLDTGARWGIKNGMWTFGLSSAPEFLRTVAQYTIDGHAEKIQTPTLVLDAPQDHFLGGEPRRIYDKLSCRKKFVSITEEQGGALHCHPGAFLTLSQVVFDFLAEEVGGSK